MRSLGHCVVALIWVAAACASLARAEPKPRPKRERLRIVSWNLWGLPWGLSKQREARIAAIGPALADLDPDVVALQEVWVEEDGVALMAALAKQGLVHAIHQHEGLLGSGLLIASKRPLLSPEFNPFELVGKLHKPWHGDAWARKGALEVRVDTSMGPLRLVNTHVHARYGSSEYLHVQTGQLLQLSSLVGDFGARPPPERGDPARPPLVLMGDLNTLGDTLPFELLCARSNLTPVKEDLRIDWVLTRDGGAASWKVRKVAELLTEDVDLPGGARPLSDHPAIVVDLELRPAPPSVWDPAGAQRRYLTAAKANHPWILAQRDAAKERGSRWFRRALFLVLVGGLLMYGAYKREKKRGHCLLMAASMVLLHLGVWAMYLGVVHERVEEAGLVNALERVKAGAPPEASEAK